MKDKITFSKLQNLRNESLLPMVFYYREHDPALNMQCMHAHDHIEIMYCDEGQFEIEIDGKKVLIEKNKFLIFNFGTFHCLSIPKENHCRIINLELYPETSPNKDFLIHAPFISITSNHLFLSAMNFYNHLKNKPYVICDDLSNVKDILKNIVLKLSEEPTPQYYVHYKTQLHQLFIAIDNCCPKRVDQSGIIYIKKALAYITDNYMNDITIKDVANYCGITHTHLQRLFSNNGYQSIKNSINMYRIDRAKKLLRKDMNHSQIAKACGFASRQQLIYEFKKFENISPIDYKNKINEHYITHHGSYYSLLSDGRIVHLDQK